MTESESESLGSNEHLYLTDWGILVCKMPTTDPWKKGEIK